MAGISKIVSDDLFLKSQLLLKQQGKSGEVSCKLQAIISARNNSVSEVAKIFGITRATLFIWIKKFKQGSITGLNIKQGRGRKQLLNNEQQQQIKAIILNNPNITAIKLQQVVLEDLSVTMSIASTYRLMHKLGFSYMTARKNHDRQDKTKTDTFKKTKNNTEN